MIGLAFAMAPLAGGCASKHNHDDDHHHHDMAHASDAHDDGPEATMQDIEISAVPPKVIEGFQKSFPGATLTGAERETYRNGTVHYELKFKKSDGSTADAEFDADGKLLPEHH
jgi:hypothetical protein